MLSLSRKRLESIMVGSDLLEIVHITMSAVHVKIQSSNRSVVTVRLIEGDSFFLGEGEVFVYSISKNSARLGFDYPKHISIMRTELLSKTPECKSNKTMNVIKLPQLKRREPSSGVIDKNRKLEVLELLSKFSPDELSSTLKGIANDIKNIA